MSKWTPISPWRLYKSSTVTIGASSTQSSTFDAAVKAIMISATADCHIVIGLNAAATAAATLIRAAYPPLIFATAPGELIAVIQDSTGGTLYVTELTH